MMLHQLSVLFQDQMLSVNYGDLYLFACHRPKLINRYNFCLFELRAVFTISSFFFWNAPGLKFPISGLNFAILQGYIILFIYLCIYTNCHCSARWIGNHGFSIGIDDVQPPDKLIIEKEKEIRSGYGKCDDFIEEYNKGKLELQPGHDAVLTLEAKITQVLNNIRGETAKV